jgi:hypothetical protein
MTPRQRELARHALGLDGRRSQSYRNRFVAGPDHDDFEDWELMVARRLAGRRSGDQMLGGSDLFWLTYRGALQALNDGETLDPEDFPTGGLV